MCAASTVSIDRRRPSLSAPLGRGDDQSSRGGVEQWLRSNRCGPGTGEDQSANHGGTQTNGVEWEWVAHRLANDPTCWLEAASPGSWPTARPLWGVWLDERVVVQSGSPRHRPRRKPSRHPDYLPWSRSVTR